MELVLEKNLDFLLRPRDDMWWLRKERLLVVKMQDSTARERERGGNRWLNQRQNRHQDTQMRKKKPNRKEPEIRGRKKHNQR